MARQSGSGNHLAAQSLPKRIKKTGAHRAARRQNAGSQPLYFLPRQSAVVPSQIKQKDFGKLGGCIAGMEAMLSLSQRTAPFISLQGK